MKLFFLCKRRPMGRDLINRPYGRFYFLPYLLAQRGHEVHTLLVSHRREPRVEIEKGGIRWISETVLGSNPSRFLATARKIVDSSRPDWIIGFSDTYYGILAQRLGEKRRVRSLIDAYDNYESYIPWLKPLHYLWRRSVSKATAVTAAGPQLAEYLGGFRQKKTVCVVPMAADPVFSPSMDRSGCRRRLGLPEDKKLVGYCGSIHRSRGLDVLFTAFKNLAARDTNLSLVLSGRRQINLRLPENTIWLGYLEDTLMPTLLNSLDVLVIPNRPTAFGQFSYPVKLYEAMACSVPVVATATPPAKWILSDRPQFLVPTGNSQMMAEKIEWQLSRGLTEYGELNRWEKSCDILENLLLSGD